jgi:hypothetical protein
MFIPYIESTSYVGGICGIFKSENNNQEIGLLICIYLNIGALDTYFWLVYRLQLFEQLHIAANLIKFLRSYSENMNSEIQHEEVLLDEICVFANSSNSKIWNVAIASLLRRRGQHQVSGMLLFML